MKPLTAEQRALAEDPTHLAIAERLAKWGVRRYRVAFDDALSSAYFGLTLAARSFDLASTTPAAFGAFAKHRICGAIRDDLRADLTRGFTGTQRRAVAAPVSPESVNDFGAPVGDGLRSAELPVGWELESADRVSHVARLLGDEHGELVRALFLDAGCQQQEEAARRAGVNPGTITRRLQQAIARVRSEHSAAV